MFCVFRDAAVLWFRLHHVNTIVFVTTLDKIFEKNSRCSFVLLTFGGEFGRSFYGCPSMSQAAVSILRATILNAVAANMLSNYECMFRTEYILVSIDPH
jgi:hypothetical protein